jgi:hypothetical protein
MAQDFNQMILIFFCQKNGINKELTTSYTFKEIGLMRERIKLLLALSKVLKKLGITFTLVLRNIRHELKSHYT